MSRPFRSQKTYDAVMAITKNIEGMAHETANLAKECYGSLEPEHTKGEPIDEELLKEGYDRLVYLIESLDQEKDELEKALEKHRTCLEDEDLKAARCGDCLFLHSPVDKCALYDDTEGPCPYKIVDVKFIDIEDPNAGRVKG